MREVIGNIWDYHGVAVVAITTNGSLTRDGRAVLGRGCARQAGLRFPDLPEHLGRLIAENGNHVQIIDADLVSFPVEETAWSLPDPALIRRSALELRDLAELEGWQLVVVPRPGCGGGGLDWSVVRPLLAAVLDDRFAIITL